MFKFTSASVFLPYLAGFSVCTCIFALSEKRKYHSVWLLEIRNSCTSVFPNTCAFEQQEWNKTEREKKIRGDVWAWKEVKRESCCNTRNRIDFQMSCLFIPVHMVPNRIPVELCINFILPPGGSEWIISVGDYVDNSFTALGSSDPREVRLEP